MTRRADVRDTYDRIATHFAETRRTAWPTVERFVDGRVGRLALDLGVGNGRHAGLLARGFDRVLAADISRAVLDEAEKRAAEGEYTLSPLLADASTLPLSARCIDLALYIATIHHLPSRSLRRRSLDELERVLGAEGVALVSAWSVTHDRFDAQTAFDTTVDWTLPDGAIVARYYHIYDLAEFEADLAASALVVEEAFEEAGNCYAVVGPGA